MKDNSFKRMVGEMVLAAYNTGYDDGVMRDETTFTDMKEDGTHTCASVFCEKCGSFYKRDFFEVYPVNFCPGCGRRIEKVKM
jgi:uncharacterized OB-fold protein